ncbi:MAG TPA: tRNA lysidine(34) synthetase TilS [Actinomycetota bacterium]|nr:tRNA lysidine(34) synthetase TilS [Actinomycetota bacterium]
MAEPRIVREVLARVRSALGHHGMIKGGESVLVAVSGGPDSLCLLHALHRIAPALELDLHVAHFDHRLREGSAADASFVARTAERLGLPVTTRAASSTEVPKGLSPEGAARERRYAFLEETADVVGATRIATGHTLDDQAETVIMRVIAGTGVHGLGGIPPVRGRVIRPLIEVRRAETESFGRALKLGPRRDPTNADTAFPRNAVRADLLPFLVEHFNARAPEALARLADLARDEDDLLEELAAEALEPEIVAGGLRIPVDRLLALPVALQRRVLRRAVPLDAAHTDRVLQLCREGATGDRVSLSAPLNATLSYGSLLIGRETTATASEPAEPVALVVPGVTDLPLWSMRMRTWIETEPPPAWPDGRRVCVLDAARARPPLVVRTSRRGDRFRPLGMRGEKRLGDFFTDAKVPRTERDRVPLVTSGDEIAWVVGHRPAQGFKVTGRTRRFLWLELEEGEK